MKKSIIALSTMFLLAIGVANAQTAETTEVEVVENVQDAVEVQPADAVADEAVVIETEEVVVEQNEKKLEIKPDALPSKVQEILKSDRFNTWDVSKAYEKTDDEGKKVYEVVLTNGEKKATYNFDAEGNTKE